MATRLLSVAHIRVSEKQRRKIAHSKVKSHIIALENGEDVYPIDVNDLGDGTYTIAGNGRHRYFAYIWLGYTHIPATITSQNSQQCEFCFFINVIYFTHA